MDPSLDGAFPEVNVGQIAVAKRGLSHESPPLAGSLGLSLEKLGPEETLGEVSNIDQEWMEFFANNDATRGLGISSADPMRAAHPAATAPQVHIDQLGLSADYKLSVSTKTKILFLTRPVDIYRVFWNIPVIQYWVAHPGVVKKQMKVVSKTVRDLAEYHSRLSGIEFYTENILKQIDNPEARSIQFKDERKITIGISRRDIMNANSRVKNAFYNCFAMVIRIPARDASLCQEAFGDKPRAQFPGVADDMFREVHIKVFNTGKIEIPGVVSNEVFELVKIAVLGVLRPVMDTDFPDQVPPSQDHLDRSLRAICESAREGATQSSGEAGACLRFLETTRESNVLINSNFNCGYFVNRDALHSILRSDKYQIEASYDPCSYPGVKCKFYFNHEVGFDPVLQNGRVAKTDRAMRVRDLGCAIKYTEVSFMIFRTGSGLIVGNCTDAILAFIFDFIKTLLATEKAAIWVASEKNTRKPTVAKVRRRLVHMSRDRFCEVYGVGA